MGIKKDFLSYNIIGIIPYQWQTIIFFELGSSSSSNLSDKLMAVTLLGEASYESICPYSNPSIFVTTKPSPVMA